jgi:hypothetical protein
LVFVAYIVVVVALPVLLSAVLSYRALPRGPSCPHCSQETIHVLSHGLRVLSSLVRSVSFQHRWCPCCTWEGYVRVTAYSRARGQDGSVVSGRQTKPLRALDLGGRSWRVMLEYWREQNRCYGRLLFVAPSGRLWCDPLAAFRGATHDEVVRQALALSDPLLTYRLQEVISG